MIKAGMASAAIMNPDQPSGIPRKFRYRWNWKKIDVAVDAMKNIRLRRIKSLEKSLSGAAMVSVLQQAEKKISGHHFSIL